jgi:hypothetical protein
MPTKNCPNWEFWFEIHISSGNPATAIAMEITVTIIQQSFPLDFRANFIRGFFPFFST